MTGKKKMDDSVQDPHEAFRNRLVEDVLGSDNAGGDGKVPMEKVVMLIWQFRDDPSVVTFMARFVAKYAGSRDVFDGIEFYLPQLVHMIIHLEAEWDDAILERFALVIAQQSVHFALQLNWILQGALQDYQPEINDEHTGMTIPNPNYNPVYYMRCLKLLKNVERCVVYGKPRAQELQRLYEQGKITKKEMIMMEQADRRFNALQITNADESEHSSSRQLDGWVLVQRPAKKGEGSVARWDSLFCSLDRHVLNCYKSQGCCYPQLVLERAMALDKADIVSVDDVTVRIETANYISGVKFPSPEEKTLWYRRMSEEAASCGLFHSIHLTAGRNNSTRESESSKSLKQDLTPAQLERYEFFQSEREFVNDLCDIAEQLRFEERSERKKLAPGKMAKLEIPSTVYLPLCNSTDIWRRISDKLADQTRVFNTKARCPTIMFFVSRRGEPNHKGLRVDPKVDVAEYMHIHFDVVREMEGEQNKIEEVDEEAEEDGDEGAEKKVSKRAGGGDALRHSEHGSTYSAGVSIVWEEDEDDVIHSGMGSSSPNSKQGGSNLLGSANSGAPASGGKNKENVKGNRRVQRLLKESVVTIPQILSKRMKQEKNLKSSHTGHSRRRIVSVMDKQTELQPMVPILEGTDKAAEATDDASVVSVERSSVLVNDHIVLPQEEGDIDAESLKRATDFVSGGKSWAQRSAEMLKGAREPGETVQLEIMSCIAKSNDDLRQEVFIMQMIHYYKSVFAKAKLPIWLKTYRLLSTSSSTGLIEVLTDATSIDALKKSDGYPTEGGLRKYFETVYGGPDTKAFKAAQYNFMHSLVGYSIVSYLLGLKDRHNGNIMIDIWGHLIFIDFGFALGMCVANEFTLERSPFKLTNEYVEVMGGVNGECYKEFERLFVAGFQEARQNSQIALGLVEIMMYKSNYPCFTGKHGNGKALTGLEKRLMLRIPDNQVERRALALVRKARGHAGTYLYDVFQHATNGYAI